MSGRVLVDVTVAPRVASGCRLRVSSQHLVRACDCFDVQIEARHPRRRLPAACNQCACYAALCRSAWKRVAKAAKGADRKPPDDSKDTAA